MEKQPIEGYVAGILDERSLVINKGSIDGMKVGMRFKVLSSTPLPVIDPITKKRIGDLNREKIRVECTEVYESFSICSPFLTHWRGNYFSASAIMNELVQEKEVIETLRYDPKDKPAPLTEEESIVKIGDKCIQLIDPNVKS